MKEEAIYEPSEWGRAFHGLPHDEALGAGAAGVGKTVVLMWEPLAQIVVEHERTHDPKHPNAIPKGSSVGWALLLRRTFPMLEQLIGKAKVAFERLDPGVHYDQQKHIFTFTSGYRYQFGHCKDPNDWQMYYGSEYCAAAGTMVLMADGSYRGIETVTAGEMVQTLEGPRPVTATHITGRKPCVRATTRFRGEIVGTQIHPTTHPVLFASIDEWRREQFPGTPRVGERCRPHGLYWQDYESLLFGRRESQVIRASAIGDRIDFGGSGDLPPELERLPPWTVRVALHEHALRSVLRPCRPTESDASAECSRSSSEILPGLAQRLLGLPADQPPGVAVRQRIRDSAAVPVPCDDACETPDLEKATSSPGRCWSCLGPHGEPLPRVGGSPRDSALLPAYAEGRDPTCWPLREAGGIPIDIQGIPPRYPHFYTGESRERVMGLRRGEAMLEWAGYHETFDLTVEGGNHYLTSTGLVNSQTIIMFDELIQFMKEQYLQIKSRLRTSDPVLMKMLKVRAMSNPSVDRQGMEGVSLDDPLWVRKYFVDPARQGGVTLFQNITLKSGEKIRKTRIYFPGKLAQNPNKDFVRTYESNLQQLPAHIRQAQLEGDWYAVYGSFYGDEWIQDIHVCRPFQIPKDWLRFRSMDWGFKSHGCVHWWAMDFDGNLYCEKEFYFRLITATQCAERIRDMEKAAKLWDGGRSVITGPADTQLWERRGVSSLPMAAEFEAVGVPWVKADKLSRSRNAGLLMARLRDHKRRTQPPGIVFFDTCKMAIQTLPSVLCTVGDPEMPMDGGEDHAHDSVLYGCAFASRGRSGIPQRRSEFREEETDQDEGFKGGYGIQY